MDLSLNFGVMISISYSILVMIIHYYYFLTSMQPYTIVLHRKTFLFYTKIVLGKIISFTLFKTILCRIVLFECLETPSIQFCRLCRRRFICHSINQSSQYKTILYSITNTRSYLLLHSTHSRVLLTLSLMSNTQQSRVVA